MQKLKANTAKRWIPVVSFWLVFSASILFGQRFPLIREAWVVLLLLWVLAGAAYSLSGARRHEDGLITLRGTPRWLLRFFYDEYDEDDKHHLRDDEHRSHGSSERDTR